MRYIFANVIAAGPIDWKAPLTAEGQPGIAECEMILADENCEIIESFADASGFCLARYSEHIGSGAIVVGHSVEFHHGALRAAMIPMGIDPHDGRVMTICTMLGLTGHAMKFNGRKGWPTFAEACHWAGVDRAATESAEDNARCLRLVFAQMQRQGIVPEPKVWKERNG
jgi:hypothetical protein